MDRFVKVKKIGEGSFGKALLVRSKADGQNYVVKEISISKMQMKERQEARKEVNVLSKMKHPNIVQYIESFEENGCLYIVMEYCEGGDLYARINSQQGMAFSESKVLDWFIQTCLALKHVHDRKILHRDIKTSNIFLTKQGAIKLGDFGIARVLNNTMELARTCIGTPYYLSPEICENKPYNNKSDVWSLGCVLYEVLTLKHAFEAGNMKNLVLKIIRGSYPPVPTRYSHDLRGLVSQLFRRNPRDRPSVNSILKKPFIHRHTEKFLSPEQYEEEFSHTVLHRNRKPSQARPQSAAAAGAPGLRRKPEPRPASALKSPTNDRAKQLAGIYGKPLAVKKPSSAATRFQKYAEHQKKAASELDKRKQQFLEDEKKRREMNEKKRQEEIAARQLARADRIRAQQIRRARDNAREMNLKRSSEMFEPVAGKRDVNENKKLVVREPKIGHIPAKISRPTSAPNARPQNYEKYHQYLDRIRDGDRRGAADVASPYLAQVKAAWEDRVSAQNAVMDAIGNRVEGRMAAEQARVMQEYMQRKQEAQKNQGMIKIHNEEYKGHGVAAALQPFNAHQPKPSNNENFQMQARNRDEAEYLARLKQIRIQNFNERRAVKERQRGNPYQGVGGSLEAQIRHQKVEALQKQTEERAKVLARDVELRKQAVNKMVEEAVNKKYEEEAIKKSEMKKVSEYKARARGLVHPDERPVVFLQKPIGITQALNAVGIDNFNSESSEPNKGVLDEKVQPQQSIEGSPAPDKRRQILKRVNEKFLPSDENESKKSTETAPLGNGKVQHQWAAGDIGQKLAALPLQETASQMEATSYKDDVIMNQAKVIVAKRGWNQPSNTVVNKLNLMSLCDETAFMLQKETAKDTKQMMEVADNNNKETGRDPSMPPLKTHIITSAQRQPQPALKFSVKLDEAKHSKPQRLSQRPEGPILPDKGKPLNPANKATVVLGDVSVALLDDTPVIDMVKPEEKPLPQVPKKSLVAALAAKFDTGAAFDKGTFVVSEDGEKIVSDENNEKSNDKSHSDNKKNLQGDECIEELKLDDYIDGNKASPPKSTVEAWRNSPTKCDGPSRRDSSNQTPSSSQASPNEKISPSVRAVQDSTSPTDDSDKSITKRNSAMASPKLSVEGPLFAKVQNSPVTASSLPITSEKTDSDSTPTNNLCKTMFSTASEEMVMKLTLGHFDSPNPKLLRTCSMPDLLKSISEEEENMVVSKNSPVRLSGGSLVGKSIRSSGTGSPVSQTSSGENKECMNDTNFDDCEIDPSPELEDSEVDEDDDMASLRINLQNVLLKEEADLKGFSSDESDDEGTNGTDDSWSDDSFEEDGDNRKQDSDTESVFSRLEQNREQLERQLGIEKFLKVYKAVQAMHENEDEEVKVGESRIRKLLGEEQGLYQRVLQLVMADGAYCEDNN